MNRIASLDYLKFPLACFVVLIHATWLININEDLNFLSVNGLFRIAVPLFVMISGFFFFSVYENKKTGAWFKRLAILYVVWMLIYSPFWIGAFLKSFDLVAFLKLWLLGYHHLWYLAGVMVAALCMLPLLRLPVAVRYVAACVCAVTALVMQYAPILKIIDVPTDAFRNGVLGCLPFFVAGFEIARFHHAGKLRRIGSKYILALAFAALFAESWMIHILNPEATAFDLMVSLYIFCPLLFIWVLFLDVAGENSAHFATLSSLLYFSHRWLLAIFRHATPIDPSIYSLLTILIISAGYLCIVHLKLTRYLKYIC